MNTLDLSGNKRIQTNVKPDSGYLDIFLILIHATTSQFLAFPIGAGELSNVALLAGALTAGQAELLLGLEIFH